MDILKRLFQASQWLAFLPFLLAMFMLIVFGIILGEVIDDDAAFNLTIFILPYPSIILIRWILFKEWVFLPWKKGTTKED